MMLWRVQVWECEPTTIAGCLGGEGAAHDLGQVLLGRHCVGTPAVVARKHLAVAVAVAVAVAGRQAGREGGREGGREE